MARIHWKIGSVALAASFGGLAAVADMPACTGKDVPAPLIIPQADVPIVPVVITAGDLPPALPPVPMVAAVVGVTAETAPAPRPVTTPAVVVTELSLPVLAEPTVSPVVIPVTAAETVPVAPITPAPVPAANAAVPLATPVVPVTPREERPSTPTTARVAPVTVRPEVTTPAPTVRAEPPTLTRVAGEKRLKVMLHMGDDRPWFEVRDGNEVYLKVVCDSVDVKSPAERGEAPSVMRAFGKVFFVTPGGEGLCDELTVAPGSGQVSVCGKVAFTYYWGKTETTVSGDKMTFRLGTAPGTTPGSPTATVPASYERPVR